MNKAKDALRIGPARPEPVVATPTNAEVVERWSKITDPCEALREIVSNQNYLGYDSYYEDLRSALLDMAERCCDEKA